MLTFKIKCIKGFCKEDRKIEISVIRNDSKLEIPDLIIEKVVSASILKRLSHKDFNELLETLSVVLNQSLEEIETFNRLGF